jgi:hypothetical protein
MAKLTRSMITDKVKNRKVKELYGDLRSASKGTSSDIGRAEVEAEYDPEVNGIMLGYSFEILQEGWSLGLQIEGAFDPQHEEPDDLIGFHADLINPNCAQTLDGIALFRLNGNHSGETMAVVVIAWPIDSEGNAGDPFFADAEVPIP